MLAFSLLWQAMCLNSAFRFWIFVWWVLVISSLDYWYLTYSTAMASFARHNAYGTIVVSTLCPTYFLPRAMEKKPHIPNYSRAVTSTMFFHLLIATSLSHMTLSKHIFPKCDPTEICFNLKYQWWFSCIQIRCLILLKATRLRSMN